MNRSLSYNRMQDNKINKKMYLSLAIPFMVSGVTQPILGAVDTAVLGRLEDPSFMGGVAIGAVVFNTFYWLFGFLKLVTVGQSAQSLGNISQKNLYFSYLRPALMGLIIGLLFLVFRTPLKSAAFRVYTPAPDVSGKALLYYDTLIWGAPAVLIGYVNLGWLMGRRRIKETLFLQISTNIVNIILDLILVVFYGMGTLGVALATLVSQYYGLFLGLLFLSRQIRFKKIFLYFSGLYEPSAIKALFTANSDLFIRTICLLVMTNMFMAKGSSFGKVPLAANAILFQLQYIMAYLYEGFASASGVLAGKAYGSKDRKELNHVFSLSNFFLTVLTIAVTGGLLIFSDSLISLFTSISSVQDYARSYMIWLVFYPGCVCVGLIYYGIFISCNRTSIIRNSTIASLLLFLGTYYTLIPSWGNHGLWISFLLFCLGRSLSLLVYYRKSFLVGQIFTLE